MSEQTTSICAASCSPKSVKKRTLEGFDGAFLADPELSGKRLLLFMRRLHPKKGCDLLIQAFARVLGCEFVNEKGDFGLLINYVVFA
jgi:glycosyltransferase involved in cell wall biosynthesis